MSAAAIQDLWPTDLEPADSEPTPVAILRQQGHLLGQRTGNAVYCEVESLDAQDASVGRQPTTFTHTLFLISAYVGYSRPILRVQHDLDIYPATVTSFATDDPKCLFPLEKIEVKNAKKMYSVLKKVFARPDVVAAIQSLLRQTRDLDADE